MNRFKILILGAGASGIAAGAKLLENGFTDFRILEAAGRIGGRINTTTLDNTPIELGAEWIHGEEGNVVYELASKCDLVDSQPEAVNMFLYTNFYDSSGRLINKDISIALTAAYYNIMKLDEKNLNEEVLNGSLGSYFEIEFQKEFKELRKSLNIDESLFEKFLKTFENWENSIDASHSWYETSLRGHLEYQECEGNILTQWKNKRYNTLFNILMKKIPNPSEQLPLDCRIIFNKEVVKINWNKNGKLDMANVEVECQDGSFYFADKILITCSLGVLKERAQDMFNPCLPEKKLNCIQNLGFGTVDKIFVKFKHQWWGNDFVGCSFLWSEDERRNDTSGWLDGVICFHPIDSSSSIMRGWITGDAARVMESIPHDDVVIGINYLFEKFLGKTNDISPIEICVMSKWFTNPLFRGSYSCRLMTSEASNVWASHLAETVFNIHNEPILFFGGEATHDHYFSTVHGAVEAGEREAMKMLQRTVDESKPPKHVKLAIVGAGISGLAAAKTIFENGISDILILEALPECGGRIRSIKVDDYFLELGAQWIHGTKNEVFSICQMKNLLTDELSGEGEGLYYRENGEKLDEFLIKEVDGVIKDILENCENYVSIKGKSFHSIGDELVSRFNEYLNNCHEDTTELKQVKTELFDWHVKYHLIDNSCSDLFDLSAKAWGLFKFCGGNDYVNFKNGYSSLIDTMVNYLPGEVLRCGTSVQRIEWTENINFKDQDWTDSVPEVYNVKIITENGEIIYCQHVIVTCSLGYLKNNYKMMFCPSLPNYVSEAIENLGFGVMNKIFLIYDEPWWDEKTKGFQLVWSRTTSEESKLHWGRYLTGFDVILKDRPVLLGWVGGEGAIALEQIPEEVIGQQTTEILRRFTKNEKIPFPKKVIRTNWWHNEYFRGAYSHITSVCDELEINCSNLAQPVYSTIKTQTGIFKKPTILLAGEATHKHHYSTVHGAYESGKSQAQVILQYIEKLGK